ncbi:TonB-dependent siderophore receptor [Delftia sp. PS-11]|uniref:TonB-dependent siderophore receptor n=1 Tax=Delftia sp. PS-11 TaxID=2767222 RepID=UPI0024553FEC|nr:TonB-dependent siderophore receptor [Delftia sp. PS-11]KAJ8740850.1 TonB-dependent siderophore receptor [Delftia sp. PS-11]
MLLHCPLPLRALAAAALACALGAQAQTLTPDASGAAAPRSYDLPAQPLGSVLARIGAGSGQQISIDAELVRGRTAPAVRGSYTPEQAARAALQGSGLELVRTGSGSWGLRVAAPAPAPAGTGAAARPAAPAPAQALAPVQVTAQAIVSPTTEQTGSYTTRALSIGKMEQSIRETPQSVTVVTRQQMDDQNLSTVEDVIAQTTGTSKSQRNYGAHVYMMRGYEIPDANYLIDGVAGGAYSPTGWVPMDTAIFDRVEVLRGAGALAVGAGDPSGVVNMVRKRPRADRHFDVAQSIGSWSHLRTEIDGGGTLNEAGTVRGRVVAAYTDRHSFIDLVHTRAPMLYGVIEADLGAGTKATAGYRHQQSDIDGYTIFGLPSYANGASLGLPRSTSLGQRWNRSDAQVDDVFGELEHRMGGDWVARLTLNRSKTTVDQTLGSARGAIDPDTLQGLRYTGNDFIARDIDATGLDASVTGSFQALGGTHKVMFGASWTQQDVLTRSASSGQSAPMDPWHFDHSRYPEPVAPAYDNGSQDRRQMLGLYGSGRLQLAERLHLHLGGRLNWYKFLSDDHYSGALLNEYRQNGQFTPYAGLVYDIDTRWSAYASYTSTFVPQSQYATVQGGRLKPAVGSNYEAGIKGELFERRLNVAVSVFNIKKRDVAVLDLGNEGLCPGLTTNDCYRNASVLRSKGLDIEMGGEIARGWQIAGGYTWLTTRDDEGSSLSTDTPRSLLRVSTSYALPGEWSAWTLGANLSAQSRAYVDTVQNPGHAVLDLRASYRINRNWSATLNIGNVTDKIYWAALGSARNGAYYGMPRHAMLTLRGSF